jgi:hypothetical protein
MKHKKWRGDRFQVGIAGSNRSPGHHSGVLVDAVVQARPSSLALGYRGSRTRDKWSASTRPRSCRGPDTEFAPSWPMRRARTRPAWHEEAVGRRRQIRADRIPAIPPEVAGTHLAHAVADLCM